ncbi:MAG: biotin carboxylase [Deltaproteobacteria bacterium]|nr:biotin carboxylase [Deltaproteobacteria bacterium]
MRPLIICRGPIRKEAIDVFHEMGMTHVGILLSEKDSIVYPHALAPELRQVSWEHVHRVPDYTGASKEERAARIQQIVGIARTYGYDSVFAGYGFMAEDEALVSALEEAGLSFIGPCSHTVRAAGQKDEAKRTALKENVSVTPGVDDVTTRLLLKKHPSREALQAVVREQKLAVPASAFGDGVSLEDLADQVLNASYAKGIDLYSIDELCAQIEHEVTQLFIKHPGRRVRLKAIGGGGGKGQRILQGPAPEGAGTIESRAAEAAAPAPEKAREVLSEVKATGVGDNKNILLELNIEQTRHNEIQLVGNGDWCVALGGRDCSLQMHEQKLLEVSVTQEGLRDAISRARAAGRETEATVLESDLGVLTKMEAEGARFGRAVKLDSASTFECIVEGDRHYFMEVNTRIQVEHRVTELCYTLRFRNPHDATDYFDVESLVEAMALLARHKRRLPKPERTNRFGSGVESRLNATDDSLSPHAGGTIISWSDPVEQEIRDDQGICRKHPDTGLFMRYKVAGAYDSNIALLVTCGDDRVHSYDRLAEILRVSKIRGFDVATNLEFHYGLVNWFRGQNVMAKPTTRFVVPYLTQVGLLRHEASQLDVAYAWQNIIRRHKASAANPEVASAMMEAFVLKETLLQRPLDGLLEHPHVLSGWLSLNRHRYQISDGKLEWLDNPVRVLWDTYHYLNMERRPGAPPAHLIWPHDEALLKTALAFYDALETRLGLLDFRALDARLRDPNPADGFDAETWARVRGAHAGHQLGLEVLGILPLVGEHTGFWELKVEDDLSCTIPERLLDPKLQADMKKVLAPPPATKADEVVAVTGGMFYAQEAPGKPAFISAGEHFEKGQTLYIIEVMKMFNRVPAPFSGTVDQVLVEGDGIIVHKGQTLFKVTPDERVVERDPKVVAAEKKAHTDSYLAQIIGS